MKNSQPITPGQWEGHTQAFAAIASRCSAEQARCIFKARESHAYRLHGFTWEEYARVSFGLSRAQADNLIRQLQAFGEPFFHLSQITGIGPGLYRRIAPHIVDGRLHFHDQPIDLSPENTSKLRRAVKCLLASSRPAHPPAPPLPDQVAAHLDSFRGAALSSRERCLAHFAPNAVIVGPGLVRWTLADVPLFPWTLAADSRQIDVAPDGRSACFDELLIGAEPALRASGTLIRLQGQWRIFRYQLSVILTPEPAQP